MFYSDTNECSTDNASKLCLNNAVRLITQYKEVFSFLISLNNAEISKLIKFMNYFCNFSI